MPGLIDAHCHMSYGYPTIKGEGKGKGTTRPEFSTLKSARSAQKVLRSGVTSISVPGGTWFTDVGVRDAIRLGLMEGPRMFTAGRMIITYGCIEDDEPSWEGTPDHAIGKLCNTADEMVTEVRRQHKHGVNFIKMADSRSGEFADAVAQGRDRRRGRRGAPAQPAGRASIRAARARRAPRPRRASTGSCTPISPPTPISKRWRRAACRSCRPRPSSARWSSSASKVGRRAGAARLHPHEEALRPAVRDHAQGAQARHQAPGRHRHRQQHLHDPRRPTRQGAGDFRQVRRLHADGGDRRGDQGQRHRGRPRPARSARSRPASSPT